MEVEEVRSGPFGSVKSEWRRRLRSGAGTLPQKPADGARVIDATGAAKVLAHVQGGVPRAAHSLAETRMATIARAGVFILTSRTRRGRF